MDALKTISQDSEKKDLPAFEIGDTIRVDVNIREGDHERIQAFEGTVIARKGSGISETFTVRRVSYGVGVERVFPIHSPNVKGIKVVRRGNVRRAKLYFLRDRVSKSGNSPSKKGTCMSLFCYPVQKSLCSCSLILYLRW
jgi:large subunit ribosomal protein L19